MNAPMLSQHFSLAELTRSEAAARHGISMEPSGAIVRNLSWLCQRVLEPIRKRVGVAITVTSGYRPERLNELIGGAPNSDHIRGLAADIVCQFDARQFARLIHLCVLEDMPLKQVIVEYDQWVHVSAYAEGAIIQPAVFLVAARIDGITQYSAWPA